MTQIKTGGAFDQNGQERYLANGGSRIAAFSIGERELGTNSVSTRTIQDQAVTFEKLGPQVQTRITDLEDKVGKLTDGVALATAIANAPAVAAAVGENSISFGTGFYDGSFAGAFKYSYVPAENSLINVSVATSGNSEYAVGGGVGLRF